MTERKSTDDANLAEAIQSALAKEREEVACLVEQMGIEQYGTLAIAAAIRLRGKQ